MNIAPERNEFRVHDRNSLFNFGSCTQEFDHFLSLLPSPSSETLPAPVVPRAAHHGLASRQGHLRALRQKGSLRVSQCSCGRIGRRTRRPAREAPFADRNTPIPFATGTQRVPAASSRANYCAPEKTPTHFTLRRKRMTTTSRSVQNTTGP